LDPEEPFELIQMHHLEGPSGEAIFINCPHCGKKILVEFKELDADTVEVYWGKNLAEIRKKRKKADAEE
jgi:DNA-directed RNA polymerase subunit RPC12/RpoP